MNSSFQAIFFNLFHPSLSSLMNIKLLEVFEGKFFTLIHMKLIEDRNDAFKWFLVSINLHGDLKKNWSNHFDELLFFYKIGKNQKWKKYAFCVITFWLMEIQTHSALQNDCLNLSFVKGIYVKGGKMARIGRKIVIYESQILRNSL